MMNRIKIKNIISLILNVLTALLVIIAVAGFFTAEGLESGEGNMQSGGASCFMFFTVDSNILAAVCCIAVIPFNIKAIKSGENSIPKWALIFKFVGTVAVALTFAVVMVFLGPLMGYAEMFEGSCLELHLICPLMAIASFCFCEEGCKISKRTALFGVVPMLIYGSVYLVNVIFTKTWSDFYGFNIGGYWYITCIVMPVVTYFLSLAIGALHNIADKTK